MKMLRFYSDSIPLLTRGMLLFLLVLFDSGDGFWAEHCDISNSLEESSDKISRGFQYYHEALESENFKWRILGGELTAIREAPYAVLYGWWCAGSLIAPQWVITAAHCSDSDFVYAGSEFMDRAQQYPISRRVYHEGWFGPKRHFFDYDYKLLQLAAPVPVTSSTRPIAIGDLEDIRVNQTVLISGWGHTKYKFNLTRAASQASPRLRSARMAVFSAEECENSALPLVMARFKEPSLGLTPRMVCARGVDRGVACFGDSGGPVVANNKLVGLVSWGVHCEPLLMFANLPLVRDWIRSTTGLTEL